jgi:tetratricopeptide (TPR) repeat protein
MTTWSEEITLSPEHGPSSLLTDFVKESQRIVKSYAYFNLAFILIGITELTCCLVFFNLLTRSSLLAFTLAGFLMTLFCYFVLRIYLQNRRPELLLSLSEFTLEQLKETAKSKKGAVEQKLWIASSLCRLAHYLKDYEYTLYKPKKFFLSLSYTLEKFGSWLHWEDFHSLKEWLYLQAIECYIDLIKQKPNNLQFHVGLANTYIMLSNIYATPKKGDPLEEERWIPEAKFSKTMVKKFTLCAKRAIEEFNILNDYNPNDPWVYTQLAYSYHDLQMPQEEIKAYETILTLSPGDVDVYYKLGILYFQHGENSKGLRIYENLKSSSPAKAESLIRYYGAYNDEEVLEEV